MQIKELKFTFIFHQWNVTIKNRWFSFKIYGYMNSVGLRIGSKLGKNTRVNIDSKIETESQSWGSIHIHKQVQSNWSENFPIFPRFGIGRVQVDVLKLNSQSLQDTWSWVSAIRLKVSGWSNIDKKEFSHSYNNSPIYLLLLLTYRLRLPYSYLN